MASRTTAASIKVPSSHVTNDFDGLWSTVLTYTTHIRSWVLMSTCLFPFKVGLYHELTKHATRHNLQNDMRKDQKETKHKTRTNTLLNCPFWFTVINNTSWKWKWWNTYTALTGNFQTDLRKYHKKLECKIGTCTAELTVFGWPYSINWKLTKWHEKGSKRNCNPKPRHRQFWIDHL